MVIFFKRLLLIFLAVSVLGSDAVAFTGFFSQLFGRKEEASGPNVPVNFIGERHFNEGELREAIDEQLKDIQEYGLTPAMADDAAFFLIIFYRKQGYSQAEVTESISGNVLSLHINSGPYTELGEVTFSGNSNIDDETLREHVIGTTRERFSRLKQNLPFVEADIKSAIDRIGGVYRAKGFLDVEIEEPQIRFLNGYRRANVHIVIHEGTQYWFDKLNIQGDLVFFSRAQTNTELETELEKFTSQPYTPTQVRNIQRAIVYYYKSRGYFQAKVTVESNPENAVNGKVPTTYTIDSGSIYRFDGVTVTGTDRLDPDFLQRRFGKLNNQFYSPQKLDEVFQEMMRTGLFERLNVKSVPLEDTKQVRLDLHVQEAKSKELGFLAGYGTFEGPMIGIQAADRNLFGNGRPLTARIELSQRFTRGEILYVDPWFLESDYSFRFRIFALTQEFEGYSSFQVGVRPEISRKITRNLELSAFILTRFADLENLGIEPELFGPDSYFVNSIGFSAVWDTRNNILNPGRGFVLSGATDFASSAFGSSVEFLRGVLRFSYYLPFDLPNGKKSLLAFGARGGAMFPMNNSGNGNHSNIPIDERFFNGGSRSVRSFQERELGPHDRHGYPIGGETFTTFNVEYMHPIVGDLNAAVFVDAGSVGERISDGIGEMRYGIGAGLRYALPVGPLRLDYAINPSPKDYEERGAFHFSFGMAF